MMAWGAFLVIQNQMSAGMIFMASMISGKAFGPIDQLTAAWSRCRKALLRCVTLRPSSAGYERSAARCPAAPKGALAARGLVFAPNPEKPDYRILDNIDLDLKPGEAIVIAGAIGAGKSTMLRLLAGAIEPTAGQLTIDGIDYNAWPSAQWGDIIGYVPQDIEFFPAQSPQTLLASARMPARKPFLLQPRKRMSMRPSSSCQTAIERLSAQVTAHISPRDRNRKSPSPGRSTDHRAS